MTDLGDQKYKKIQRRKEIKDIAGKLAKNGFSLVLIVSIAVSLMFWINDFRGDQKWRDRTLDASRVAVNQFKFSGVDVGLDENNYNLQILGIWEGYASKIFYQRELKLRDDEYEDHISTQKNSVYSAAGACYQKNYEKLNPLNIKWPKDSDNPFGYIKIITISEMAAIERGLELKYGDQGFSSATKALISDAKKMSPPIYNEVTVEPPLGEGTCSFFAGMLNNDLREAEIQKEKCRQERLLEMKQREFLNSLGTFLFYSCEVIALNYVLSEHYSD